MAKKKSSQKQKKSKRSIISTVAFMLSIAFLAEESFWGFCFFAIIFLVVFFSGKKRTYALEKGKDFSAPPEILDSQESNPHPLSIEHPSSVVPSIQITMDEPVYHPKTSFNEKHLTVNRIDFRYDKSILSLSDYVVLDVETTGLDPNYDKIIEIGMIKVSDGSIVDRFETLVNPERHISSGASKVNGIYDEDVFTAPKYLDIVDQVVDFLNGQTVVGHNVSFDLRFLNGLYAYANNSANLNYIDTLYYSKFVFPNQKSYKLSDLAADFDLIVSHQHRALSDVETTMQLFELCRKEIIERNEREKAERKQKSAEAKAERIAKYSTSPLYNVNFVFTGVFNEDRIALETALLHLGANVRQKVNSNTSYLVAGNIDPLPDWAKERKYNVAVDLIKQGKKVKIIDENECISIIENTKKVFVPIP